MTNVIFEFEKQNKICEKNIANEEKKKKNEIGKYKKKNRKPLTK